MSFGVAAMQVQVFPASGVVQYLFDCPLCQILVVKPAGEQAVEALSSIGVVVKRMNRPAELDEPRVGPPICWDDLLSFHQLLEGETWREELVR